MSSAPIRISYVIGSLAVGGAETQLVRLVNGLDRDRFRPSIICMSEGGALEDAVARDVPVIRPYESPASKPSWNRAILGARILTRLARAIRTQQPDIVHSYLPAAYVLGSLSAWWLRVPVIVAGRRGLTSVDIYGAVRWRLLAEFANRVIDVHICNSNAVRDLAIARERLKPEKTRVIHNGIDVPLLQEAPELPPEWESEAGHAVMVANLIRYKGHREVLQAVAVVVRRHPAFRLVLIGGGPERPDLVDRARNLGITENVVFAGALINAASLVEGFDFAILGSSEEGFPNALMESMARAVPVISTAVGGVPELVVDGKDGRLVPFGDIAAMADAISWMIEHPEERRLMGDAGRRRIAEHFSIDRMVTTTEAVYSDFVRRRHPARSLA